MSPFTRRDFLATTSLALAEAALRPGVAHAHTHMQALKRTIGRSTLSANAFLPLPMSGGALRALATSAVDAARSAGAPYADVRVAERRRFQLGISLDELNADSLLGLQFSYGIRVLVDGAWAFVYGTAPSVDAITASARDAVATARGYAKLTTDRVELLPVPVVTGEWTTPIQLDPFTVPLQDQTALLNAYRKTAERVRRGSAVTSFRWTQEMRVFASSEGSLITQTLYQSDPQLLGCGSWGPRFDKVTLRLPNSFARSGGYEAVAFDGALDHMQQTTEEAVALAVLPRRSLDVGRYVVMLDGSSLGAVFRSTVGTALEVDRVLGYDADAAGTSYLAPPEARLGTAIVSPLLNVTARHSPPALTAIRWDDEGVETHDFPVITQGQLVNYYTSRATAPSLQTAYARAGLRFQSNACATASEADRPVMVGVPHLTVAPNVTPASFTDLYRDVSRGVLIRGVEYVMVNQQLTSGSFAWGAVMLEIARGKVVRRIESALVQFATDKFWKSLVRVGDASTVRTGAISSVKGQPSRMRRVATTAPAGVFNDVNVTSTAITL